MRVVIWLHLVYLGFAATLNIMILPLWAGKSIALGIVMVALGAFVVIVLARHVTVKHLKRGSANEILPQGTDPTAARPARFYKHHRASTAGS